MTTSIYDTWNEILDKMQHIDQIPTTDVATIPQNAARMLGHSVELTRVRVSSPVLKRESDALLGFYATENIEFTLRISSAGQQFNHHFLLGPGEFKYALYETSFIPILPLQFVGPMELIDIRGNLDSLMAIHCFMGISARREMALSSWALPLRTANGPAYLILQQNSLAGLISNQVFKNHCHNYGYKCLPVLNDIELTADGSTIDRRSFVILDDCL